MPAIRALLVPAPISPKETVADCNINKLLRQSTVYGVIDYNRFTGINYSKE